MTGDVKRNGVAFMVINSKVTPLFVELSGRIRFNNGAERARSDKEKLVKQFVKLLKLKKIEGSKLPRQFYVRYHGKIIINHYMVYNLNCTINKNASF